MAITLAQLRARAEALADEPASSTTTFVTLAQFNEFVNDGIRALYNDVIAVQPEFRVTLTPFSITSTSTNYTSLPADFHSVRFVQVYPGTANEDYLPRFSLREGQLQWRRSYRVEGSRLYIEPRENAVADYRLGYCPSAPVLTTESGAGGTLDVELEQFQDVIVLHAAIMARTKNEDDFADLAAQLGVAKARAAKWATGQRSADPSTVEDVRSVRFPLRRAQ
jgi:hypothetical protein